MIGNAQWITSRHSPQILSTGQHETRSSFGLRRLQLQSVLYIPFHQGQPLSNEVSGVSPAPRRSVPIDGVALWAFLFRPSGVPNENDGLVYPV